VLAASSAPVQIGAQAPTQATAQVINLAPQAPLWRHLIPRVIDFIPIDAAGHALARMRYHAYLQQGYLITLEPLIFH
jgi:DNA polymerase IIIc chi subunit